MPCDSGYLNHTEREAESGRVLELLKEIAGQPFNHDEPSYYGNLATLDADTVRLCDWCKGNTDHLSGMSLDLQLWWRKHQAADAKREAEERNDAEQRKVAERALDKLTPTELKALGLRRETRSK